MRRERRFIRELMPILIELRSHWFPADKIFDDGNMRACTYCSLNCSRHDKHDDDCLYEQTKRTLESFENLEQTVPFMKNFKGENYSQEDITNILLRKKVDKALELMFPVASRIIPLDLDDPANRGICCECSMAADTMDEHHPLCPRQKLARVYSNLFKVKGPRP